jgi:hypothetical protein
VALLGGKLDYAQTQSNHLTPDSSCDTVLNNKGDSLKTTIGFLFIVFGSFVAALNLACMFPDPAYAASWGKVFFATAIALFGGVLFYKSTK